MKKIILITWPNGSGKWTAAKYLHEKYGAVLYSFSAPLQQILSDLWVTDNRENLDKLSRSMRTNFGEGIMWGGVKAFIENHPHQFIVLEGIRRKVSMREFEELVDTIIWIDAPLDTRYARVSARWEKDWELSMSRERFESQESLESEKNLSEFRDIADIIIDNNWTYEELCEKINALRTPSY